MQNHLQGKPYRTLLLERQGRSFTEMEVAEILRQVLPQLVQIHAQGLIHGAISVDTLVQDQSSFQPVLINNPGFAAPGYIAPEQLQTGQMSAPGDIYALGVTMIVLLTGQNPEQLQNYDGSWNWQDSCFVSDQLVAVLEKAIAPQPQYRYGNAMQMQEALSPKSKTILPEPQNIPATSTNWNVSQSASSNKLAVWQWVAIGAGIALLTGLAGFGLTSLLAKKDEPATVVIPANPVVETPIVSNPTPSPTPESKPSPAELIREHYSLLNNRAYEKAWRNLTPEFQGKSGTNSPYLEYIDWWNSVSSIQLGQVTILEQTNNTALVNAQLSYLMRKGNTYNDPGSRIYLTWNESEKRWQIQNKFKP
jgi:serine/threonine protein kinase